MKGLTAIERRLRALEAQAAPEAARAPRHIMVDLIADRLSGNLSADERRQRIAEAKGQARPQDLVIVVDCPSWKEGTHVR